MLEVTLVTREVGVRADLQQRPKQCAATERMTTMELIDPVLGYSDPGTAWTTANIDEACPNVMSPLCWSVWNHGYEAGALKSQYDLGLVTDEENHSPEDVNHRYCGVFFGRLTANINRTREAMARMPGISADDFERDWFGVIRDDAPEVDEMPEREPFVLECLARQLAAHPGRLAEHRVEQSGWWQREVFDVSRGKVAPTGSPLDRLKEARERFSYAFYVHAFTRYFLPGLTLEVTTAVQRAAPELTDAVLAGYGGLEEASLADTLWQVCQGEVDSEDFLRSYGFHGPYEGNVYTSSWREEPERVAKFAAQYAKRDDFVRPGERAKELIAARREAEQRLLEAVPVEEREALEGNLRGIESRTRELEVGKSLYVMAFDGCRAAARDLGRDLVNEGRLVEVDDVFFFLVEELEALETGRLEGAKELVAYRREQREKYLQMSLPSSWVGMPEPIVAADASAGHSSVLTGSAGGGGRIVGRARVILEAGADVELEENDILVCRFTDPGWTPLMALAAGIVTDIGNASSHGAVVARELGLPYVVGTRNACQVIPDGATIALNGGQASVEVLAPVPST